MSIRLFQHQHKHKANDQSDHLESVKPEIEDNHHDVDEAPSNVWLFACAACLFVLWRAGVVDA